MKIERTKNATRNIFYGGLLKIYQIIIPFIMRTAMIYLMGVQYLGLNSLFSSILQVLNLAELGVGSAMVYSMYKPIAQDDTEQICALMGLYRTYYRAIGLVIAAAGTILVPFIPHLVKKDVPADINIYILYILNLSVTVLSYWLFAYKNCLLAAYQRIDITSKVTIVTNTIQYSLQILVLLFLKNYYIYVMVALAAQAITNIVTALVVTKLYPDYKPQGKLDKSVIGRINQQIKDLFTAKFGSVIVGSADTIVISAFLGLTVLAVYQNYYYIMNAVCSIIGVMFLSVTAGIGNSLITETLDKNYRDLKKFTFIIAWLLCVSCCCFAGMYQPFMKLWVGEKYVLDDTYVILFCVYFYVCEMSMVWATIKDAAGLWHRDRFRPLIGASVNLLLNLILVQFIGLYGILLSTIISYVFITMPWLVYNLFSLLYKRSMKEYVITLVQYILITMISCALTVLLCGMLHLSGITRLAACAMISFIIPNAIQLILFYRKEEFTETVRLVQRIVKR